MNKKLLVLLCALFFIGCSKNEDPENISKESVKFKNSNIELNYGESSFTSIDKPIKDCNFTIKDSFNISVLANADVVKINALKAGKTYIYVEYKGVKDSCLVNIKPKTFYFGSPILNLGVSRDSVINYMKSYQQGGVINGYTGLNYNFNINSEVFYQFDNANKLVAIKQVLKRSSYSIDNILKSMEERFGYLSSSSAVYWYSHKNVMTVRIENTIFDIVITYAKDSQVMYENFPWA